MRITITIILGLLLCLGAFGCGDDVEEMARDEGTEACEDGVDHSGHGNAMPSPPRTPAKKLRFKKPASWQDRETTSSFQYAKMVLPQVEADRENKLGEAVLTVNWSPGGLGDLDANIVRWVGMVSRADGSPMTRKDAEIGTREVNGLTVTTIVATGKYGSGAMGGAHASGEMEGATLFAAYVEVTGGAPYYIRAVGPEASMAAIRADLEKFIDSLYLQ